MEKYTFFCHSWHILYVDAAFPYPQFRKKTAESITEELVSFSLTIFFRKNGKKRKVWSNYRLMVIALWGRKLPVLMPKASGQAVLDEFTAQLRT